MTKIRRSVLFMPGSNMRAMEKARGLPCDVVALDLEDAVAPEAKDSARVSVCAAIRERRFTHCEVAVRINALSSPWGKVDLAAVRAAGADAILLPKVSGADDVLEVIEDGRGPELWAMIETTHAVLNIREIAASGAALLMLGANDLLKEMRAAVMPNRENLWSVMTGMVIAARANGIGVLDGTFNAIDDEAGLAQACEQGKAFGFDGKTLIHPAQIETCNRIFAPSPQAIAQAHRILDAFAKPENADRGVLELDGRMVERLHAENAARLIARAGAIAAKNA